MDARSLAALAAVLALILAALWLTAPPAGGSAAMAPLPQVNASAVTRISLGGPGGARVELARRGDGWVLPGEEGSPASQDAVDALLRAVEGMGPGERVGRNASKHALYELSDGSALRLELEAGGAVHVVLVGKMGPDPATTFVRLPGEDSVYLARSMLWLSARPDRRSFVERALVRCEPGEVASLTLSNGTRAVALSRAGGNWTAEPAGSGDPSAAEAAVRAACSLDLADTASGLPWPGAEASAELVLPSGPVRLELAPDLGGVVPARLRGRDAVVLLASGDVREIMAPLTE